jgi:enoyl-[acyl-carrier protein] reductase I
VLLLLLLLLLLPLILLLVVLIVVASIRMKMIVRTISTRNNNTHNNNKKVALIMGVANQRSIAWNCIQSFLQYRPTVDWDVILTYQYDNDKIKSKIQSLIDKHQQQQSIGNSRGSAGRILGAYPCDVTDDASVGTFFHDALPEALHRCYHHNNNNNNNIGDDNYDNDASLSNEPQLNAVIHSIAYAPDLKRPLLGTTKEGFLLAHEVSSYSLIQVARESVPYMKWTNDDTTTQSTTTPSMTTTSITTLSYLGAIRAIPGYNCMGPAKASLESVVRGLALEMGGGQQQRPQEVITNSTTLRVRVNAIRAGPIPTLSSKGGIANFDLMRHEVERRAPLGRNVTADEVASTVYHVAAEAGGMTGQIIDVDGGYSTVMGPIMNSTQ